MYTEADAQCDKVAEVDRRKYCQLSSTSHDGRQFITLSS